MEGWKKLSFCFNPLQIIIFFKKSTTTYIYIVKCCWGKIFDSAYFYQGFLIFALAKTTWNKLILLMLIALAMITAATPSKN